MRKVTIILIAAIALGTFYSGYAVSQNEAAEKEIINKICPVMGGGVDRDTPYTAEYKGKKIGLCCSGCITTFNADPEKYMQKLQKRCIIKCPKCGAEIDMKKECKKQQCPLTKDK